LGEAFGDGPTRVTRPNFLYKNLQARYMDVRHINFKTLFQSAPEHNAIFIQKLKKKFCPPQGRGKPLSQGKPAPALTSLGGPTAPRPSSSTIASLPLLSFKNATACCRSLCVSATVFF